MKSRLNFTLLYFCLVLITFTFINLPAMGGFQSLEKSAFNNDGCCNNCLDGSVPQCPEGYKYWCVFGRPDCCKLTTAGPECTDVPDPACFYPDYKPVQNTNTLCNSSTRNCPDGSPISCPDGYSFYCLKGFPDCCKLTVAGLECTDEIDPICYFTKKCTGNTLTTNNTCCMVCPDFSVPKCPQDTNYWCVDGRPRCCYGSSVDELLCVPETEGPVCNEIAVRNYKCTEFKNDDPCCKSCQSGTSPTCSDGKEPWCVNNLLTCCKSDGTGCSSTPACPKNYKCPGSPLPDSGCCKSCPNRINRPVCTGNTEYWCVGGRTDCCTMTPAGLVCTVKKNDPICPKPKRNLRQCN